MKSCRNCRKYKSNLESCELYSVNIIDKTVATYCKSYKDKRNLNKNKVQCLTCSNLNKYSWCNIKKRCFSEEEQQKLRSCIKYKRKKTIKK